MMDDVIPPGQGLAASFGVAGVGGAAPSLPLYADAYLPLLAEIGLTEEQSRELYAVLETIARGFVEYAWSGEVCGQLLEGFQTVLSSAVEPLESGNPNQQEKGDRSHDA